MSTFPDIRILYFLTEIPDDPIDIPDNPSPFDDQVVTAITEVTAELDLPPDDVN
jgi:hypothetical protein